MLKISKRNGCVSKCAHALLIIYFTQIYGGLYVGGGGGGCATTVNLIGYAQLYGLVVILEKSRIGLNFCICDFTGL